jgi:hypothetical protein
MACIVGCQGQSVDFGSDGEGGAGNTAGEPPERGGSGAASGAGTGGVEPGSAGATFGGAGGTPGPASGGAGNTAGASGAEGGRGEGGDGGTGAGGTSSDGTCTVLIDSLPSTTEYLRIRYDERSHILSRERSSEPNFAPVRYHEEELLESADGHLVLLGAQRDSAGWMPFRFDRFYNEQRDLVEAMATYTNETDLSVTPPEPHYSRIRYSHEYDSGRLTRTEETFSHPGSSAGTLYQFEEDDDGRCSRIETTFEDNRFVETRTYDGRQLTRLHVEGARGTVDYELVTEVEYDGEDRVTRITRDGSIDFFLSLPDGVPDMVWTYEYSDDGSAKHTLLDFTADIVNDTVERNGEEVSVYREELSFSPQCAVILRTIPSDEDASCRFRVGESPIVQLLNLLR